jgi:hypothetical protein
MHRTFRITLGLLALATAGASASVQFTEDFAATPFGDWSFGVGSNANSQFAYSTSAPAFSGDAAGELNVHLDSSLPTARFQAPLGGTLGDATSFTLSAIFSFTVTSAPSDGYAQMAFGLVNSTLTGGDRTGSFADFSSDNVFHAFEFNYYPNPTSFGGRALQPAVFGARSGTNDAFTNFAPSGVFDGRLGDNTVGVAELPASTLLKAELHYDAPSRQVTLQMHQVAPDGSLAEIETELPVLDLDSGAHVYNTALPFSVDAVAIMAYQDGYVIGGTASLVADLTFHRIEVSQVPEPAVCGFLACGALLLARRRR